LTVKSNDHVAVQSRFIFIEGRNRYRAWPGFSVLQRPASALLFQCRFILWQISLMNPSVHHIGRAGLIIIYILVEQLHRSTDSTHN